MAGCRSCLFAFLFILSVSSIQCEFFTALVDLEHLVSREEEMQKALKSYVAVEEAKLATIKKFISRVETAHELAKNYKDVGAFLGHPVNSFGIIRRFYTGWPQMEQLAVKDTSEDFTTVISRHKSEFPSQEDIDGAIAAMLRLQETYRLTPQVLSSGKLPKAKDVPKMSVGDTFQIGRSAYLGNDLFYTRKWMEVTLKKIEKGEDMEDVNLFDVYDHLAFSEYQRNDFKQALNYSLEMVRLDPLHKRAQENVAYFGEQIAKNKRTGAAGDTGTITDPGIIPDTKYKRTSEREYFHRTKAFLDYEKLCRGEVRNLTKWEMSKMVCWHIRNDPLTIIKPGRVERVFIKPEVVVFRNFFSDAEIKKVQELAIPRPRSQCLLGSFQNGGTSTDDLPQEDRRNSP